MTTSEDYRFGMAPKHPVPAPQTAPGAPQSPNPTNNTPGGSTGWFSVTDLEPMIAALSAAAREAAGSVSQATISESDPYEPPTEDE